MKSRLFALAAAILGAVVVPASGWSQAAKRYRLDVKTIAVQDLSAVGQGEQRQEFSFVSQVSVSSTDSAEGQTVSVLVDSVQLSPGAPLPPQMVEGLVGSTWSGFRGKDGRVIELKSSTEVQGGGILEGALQQLFPPMAIGTAAGKNWTDTLDTEQNGVSVRTVINFVTADTTHQGARALRLAGASSSAISGVQESPQGSMNVEGTATGTVTWLVGSDRTLLAGAFAQDQALEITVPSLPTPIPVKVHNEGTSSLIR